jgi:PAS domain S-box-containing protein
MGGAVTVIRTAGPVRFAILFAVTIALILVVGGWIAIEHEHEHRLTTKAEVRTAEGRAAYTLVATAIDLAAASGAATLEDPAFRRSLDGLVAGLGSNSMIRKVKLFDPRGQLIYANPAGAADPGHDEQALQAALGGSFAKQTREVRDWPVIGGRTFDGHIFGAYFPHRLGGGTAAPSSVDAVVEVYVDVTDLMTRSKLEFDRHVVAIIAGLAAAYLFFVAMVAWGTRAMVRMQRVEHESVTALMRNEGQLREAKRHAEESEAFLREAIASMENGFLLLDTDKRCLFWNARYVELLPPVASVLRRGAGLRELISALAHSPLYAIPEAERARWTDAAVPRLWSGRPFRRRLNDGRTLRIALTPTRDGGRVLSLQDVTADVLAEDRMSRLGLVAEHTDNAVIIASADGAVEWANAGFTRITGLASAEIEGRRLVDVLALHEGDAPERRRIDEAIAGGDSFEAELQGGGGSGESYWLQLASTPVRDDLGHVTRHVVIASDVTALKDQEQRLADMLSRERELAAQQKRFVAVAAHELRTPLTIIDGAAQRLVRDADHMAPAELRERAARIRVGVARLSELVNSTLDSARLDEGRLALDVRKVDLSIVVADVARRLTGISGAMRVAISGADAPVEIEGDARLLDRIFVNLLSNAIKYSGESRRVEIAIEDAPESGSVSVSVRDHGIGIPEAELSKLFERFYRASTARGLPGTGIGLHLVRELVELHGGRIEVRSTVGQGSEFTVRLPRRQDRGDGAAAGIQAAE